MKALLVRIAAGMIALGGLLYFLACSTPTPTGNVGQNQNLSANSQNTPTVNTNTAALDLGPCKPAGNPPQAAAATLAKLKTEILASPLAKLLKTTDNPDGTFTVDVQPAQGKDYFEGYVKGEIGGDDNLKILSDILNNFQDTTACMREVYFVQNLSAPSTPGGFKWSSCEYPQHVCPNGECCEVEPVDTPQASPTPTATPNPVTNSGTSVNAEKNANTNK